MRQVLISGKQYSTTILRHGATWQPHVNHECSACAQCKVKVYRDRGFWPSSDLQQEHLLLQLCSSSSCAELGIWTHSLVIASIISRSQCFLLHRT